MKYRLNKSGTFAMLVALFFMWAFLTSMNDVLIPFVKDIFKFGYLEASLVQFCFFGAFAIMAVPSAHLLKTFGYRKGIILGLIIMGIGCVLFYPAAQTVQYWVFLLALFILATGVTILQVAANPYVAVMGDPERAASRLNLAQAFNSFGTVLAPIIGSVLILRQLDVLETAADKAHAVEIPYLLLACLLLLLAIIFYVIKLPDMKDVLTEETSSLEVQDIYDFKRYRHLWLGALAIFCYVGAEVSTASYLINFMHLDTVAGFSKEKAGTFLGQYYWGGLMVGRFLGAWIGTQVSAHKHMAMHVGLALLLTCLGLYTQGTTAMWALLGLGFCNSILWSNIFTLSIRKLGMLTPKGSGLLVMAIVGGALIPPLQGFVADSAGLQSSFWVVLVCYVYLLFYALKGYQLNKELQ